MVTSAFIIIFCIGMVLLNIFKFSKNLRRKSIVIIGFPTVIAAYIVLKFQYLVSTYLDIGQAKKILGLVRLIFQGEITSETTSGRTEIVEYGIKAISNRPIFGNGLGYFQYFPAELGFEHGVHNTHLLVLGDAGIIAFLVYLFYMFYIWIKSLSVPTLIGMFSFGCIFIWAMQGMGGHNGLDDKMSNILTIMGSMYLAYGLSPKK